MKRLICIGLFFYLLVALGCKVHKKAEGKEYAAWWQEVGVTGSRFSGYHYADSLIHKWKQELTGKMVVWSPPDSTGMQYIQAEVDLQSAVSGESGRLWQSSRMDTTYVEIQKEQTATKERAWQQETIRESRSFNCFLLIVLATFTLLSWFFYYKKRMNR